MIRYPFFLLLAALLVAPVLPAQAQTDDRVLNDVLVLLRGETLVTETARLCLEFADMDLSADTAGWRERNAATLDGATALIASRGGLQPGVREAVVEAAGAEAAESFVREADRPTYCENMGESIDGGTLDLATWFPAQSTRVGEAADGKWPPLDLTGAQPVADAIAVKQLAFRMDDVFVRCGVLDPPAAPYEEARVEWQARNFYTGDLAERVLHNWGALAPERWEAARDASGTEVDALFADAEAARAYCAQAAAQVSTGALDVDQVRPDLYESVFANAEVIP